MNPYDPSEQTFHDRVYQEHERPGGYIRGERSRTDPGKIYDEFMRTTYPTGPPSDVASETDSRREKRPTPVQATISDDRSYGSEFDRNASILSALRRPVQERPFSRDRYVGRMYPKPPHYPVPSQQNEERNPYAADRPPVDRRVAEDDSEEYASDFNTSDADGGLRRIPTYHGLRMGTPVPLTPPLTPPSALASSYFGIQSRPKLNGILGEDSDFRDGMRPKGDDRSVPLSNALRVIARALNIQNESALTIETLQEYVSDLQAKEKAQTRTYPKVQLVHRVQSIPKDKDGKKGSSMRMYLDPPLWLEGEKSRKGALAGNLALRNVSSYLSKHAEICCIIYRDYFVASKDNESESEDWDINVSPAHDAETIEPVTKNLVIAITKFLEYYGFNMDADATTEPTNLMAPYIAIYHAQRDDLGTFLETLEGKQQTQFRVLLDYITTQYENEYRDVDDMTRKGKITQEYVKYLFRPGDIIVQGNGKDARGYSCKSWLRYGVRNIDEYDEILSIGEVIDSEATDSKRRFTISAWHWAFDGQFSRKMSELSVEFDAEDFSEKNINELNIRPLTYVDEATKERLWRRGEWLWKCRVRHMVSYDDISLGSRYLNDERYMIDMMMYRELHKSEIVPRIRPDNLEAEAMKRDEPPDEGFIYTTPLTVKGYNLKRKKWFDLEIDRIREVTWNTRAFESLVLKRKTKRLIQALVSNQIEAEKSTDLISGKGNGLILLLHGGPGTGKTLTAESVAEIAKKPLYPVTCGDIGTKPEDVEKYLESVLYLGKTWGCVVLLDEADVFLEQRSLEDLQRNALVSVFLRVLEYYDGILILTSNRVGTFDEAFKSRIQLAVHYNSLDSHQRFAIWGNFIRRLKELGEEGIDFVDLEDNIGKLASREMNGREIRNVITTARQYARWERQEAKGGDFKLNYNVMKDVIETAGEFDQYIKDLNNGLSQDQLAAEDGIR